MQRLWEQITSGSVPGVETDKSSANAAMTEKSVAQSVTTTKGRSLHGSEGYSNNS